VQGISLADTVSSSKLFHHPFTEKMLTQVGAESCLHLRPRVRDVVCDAKNSRKKLGFMVTLSRVSVRVENGVRGLGLGVALAL